MSIKQVHDSREFSMHDSVKYPAAESRAAKMLREVFQSGRPLNFVEGGELDLCMEIAGRTDNRRILRSLRSLLYATGVVSGEDGIARAYESKAEAMKGYLENTNPRIAAFAKEMHDSFIGSAQVERKRVVEEQQLRKIEFEG